MIGLKISDQQLDGIGEVKAEASGKYAYVIRDDSLKVVNISKPEYPTLVGSLKIGGGAVGSVVKAGNYAYIATSGGLKIVDVSSKPEAPFLVGNFNADSLICGVAVVGKYAYLNSGCALKRIHIENQAAPVFVENLKWKETEAGCCNKPLDATVIGGCVYVYLIDRDELKMFKILEKLLESIAVNLDKLGTAEDNQLQFTATGIYDDNSRQDITDSVVWSSSNTAVATIDNSACLSVQIWKPEESVGLFVVKMVVVMVSSVPRGLVNTMPRVDYMCKLPPHYHICLIMF